MSVYARNKVSYSPTEVFLCFSQETKVVVIFLKLVCFDKVGGIVLLYTSQSAPASTHYTPHYIWGKSGDSTGT